MSHTIWLIFVTAAIIPFAGILILNWESFSPSLNLNFNKKQTTLTPISPTPTSLPKFISQSSCVVLDEAYCKAGKVVNYQGKFFGLAFKVPKDAKIYAPFKGVVDASKTYTLDKKQYLSLTVDFQLLPKADKDNTSFSAVTFAESIFSDNKTEQGQDIGKVSEKTISIFGDYNLVLRFERFNPKTKLLETDFDLFKKYFDYVQN